jgi:hypothetical protein
MLAHKTYLCVEEKAMEVSISKNRFQLFSAIFGHKWVAMVAHRVLVCGQECSRHLG